MAIILNIETSTEVCSAGISENGENTALLENDEGLNHSVLLGGYIRELLNSLRNSGKEMDAVAVSMGPGSYTGLRIGISMAKGLCFGTGKPLIAVSTLRALASGAAASEKEENLLYCPMLDARRMEVYTGIYDGKGNTVEEISAKIITPDSFAPLLDKNKILFFGNGSTKVKTIITHPNALFRDDIKTSAAFMAPLSEHKFRTEAFEDTAYFEPFYLKDFIATVPKHKII